MVRKHLYIIGLSSLLSISLIWYFFIKKNDYSISFKVKAAPGTVFYGIQAWSATQEGNVSVVKKKNFNFIEQEIENGYVDLVYCWNIQSVNDSVSKVNVGIKDLNNSFYNRITLPFFNTSFKTEQVGNVKAVKEALEEHIKNFKIKIDGVGKSEETFVAYINLKCSLEKKAQAMMKNDAIITGFLHSNSIRITGRPYVEINHWDQDNELLDFNYCFPINKATKMIVDEQVKFKTLASVKGLQATYWGNFMTSDRAWFALLDYAKRHGYNLTNKPLEHFLANPFDGGDELTWEAKIIIPFALK